MFDVTAFNKNAVGHRLDDFHKVVDNFFKNDDNISIFKMDVKEEESKYMIDADLPGVNKSDINVEMQNGYLTIAVKHEENKDKKDNAGKYLHRERRMNSMQRTIYFPDIQNDNIDAKYDNGVLHISIPKIMKTSTPKIEIK